LEEIVWLTFNELCNTLRITPAQCIRLIKTDRIKYVNWGRNYRTHYRYIDPGSDPKLHILATGTADIDLPSFPVISAAEFATIAGVSQNRIRALTRRGNVKPSRMGGVNVYSAKQVRDVLLKRERRTPRDRKPLIKDIVKWFLAYYQTEHAESYTKQQLAEDDAIELQLRRMMRLPPAQRSKVMRTFWLKVTLAKQVAESINENGQTEAKPSGQSS
jgi:DNA-binding transcriptional MerR regulator